MQSRGSVSDRQQISNCARSSGTRSIIKARSSSYFLHPHGRCNQVGYAHMGPASETNEDIRALFQPCPPRSRHPFGMEDLLGHAYRAPFFGNKNRRPPTVSTGLEEVIRFRFAGSYERA